LFGVAKSLRIEFLITSLVLLIAAAVKSS